jgi:hypothetical protein
MKELWKAIPGYEWRYEVSNKGRVRSVERLVKDKNGVIKPVHAKELTLHKNKVTVRHPSTRYHVELWRDNKRKAVSVHRLVALTFIPNPEGKPQVNHKDGNTTNNVVANLEWATSSENNKHARVNKLIRAAGGKPVRGTNILTGEVIEFDNAGEAARYFNVTPTAIRASVKGYGRAKNACGFKWEYQ